MNGGGLGALGGELGDAIIGPAVRKALNDPNTLKLAEIQIASILESDTVKKAVEPVLKRLAIIGFGGVIAGALIANLIARKI